MRDGDGDGGGSGDQVEITVLTDDFGSWNIGMFSNVFYFASVTCHSLGLQFFLWSVYFRFFFCR